MKLFDFEIDNTTKLPFDSFLEILMDESITFVEICNAL